MKIDLHKFFEFYDKKNIKHVASIEQLEQDLEKYAGALLEDNSNWVRIYRTKLDKAKTDVRLEVPYYPQTDNYRDASRTCNSSSCAMCLEYFKPGTLNGAKGDDAYVQRVFAKGDTTDHEVQTRVLSDYGIISEFRYNLTFSDIDRELAAERPVVIGILHRGTLYAPTGGHMVVVIGKTENGNYVVNDPYGSLNDGYTTDVYNGKGAIYNKSDLSARWCPGGNNGWGRIFNVKTIVNKDTLMVPVSGLRLIKEFEGCHLDAYPDPLSGGLPITIGWGSTRKSDGSPFRLGDKISQKQADDLLLDQCEKEFLPKLSKIPYWGEMSDGKRGALLSFAYNLGAEFYNSGDFNTITKRLKNKEWDKVPDALYLYRNPGSNVEAGLARRRKAEGIVWNS